MSLYLLYVKDGFAVLKQRCQKLPQLGLVVTGHTMTIQPLFAKHPIDSKTHFILNRSLRRIPTVPLLPLLRL